MANLSTILISGSNQYITITDHASNPSPTAGKLYANSTSIYWEDTDLAAGGGDSMTQVKSQGPTTDGASSGSLGLANTTTLMGAGANTAVNVLVNQNLAINGGFTLRLHVGGDVNMPGLAITSDGTNSSQTFNDLAAHDHTVTAGNDVHHDSGGSVSLRMSGKGFGSGTDTAYNDTAIYFDGTNDYLTVPLHDDFQLDGDFTLETWYYFSGAGSAERIMDTYASTGPGFKFFKNASDKIGFHARIGDETSYSDIVCDDAIAATQWYHVAVTRENGVGRIFINGENVKTTHGKSFDIPQAIPTAGFDSGKGLAIGAYYNGSAYADDLTGYLDNIRVTKGYARYTSDFSQFLPIIARKFTLNRNAGFTVKSSTFYAGGVNGVSVQDSGFTDRTGDDTVGDGRIQVAFANTQTVNSTSFMVPIIFRNTSTVDLSLNYNIWASVRATQATDDTAISKQNFYGGRGIIAHGYTTTNVLTADYITIGSTGNGTDFGEFNEAGGAYMASGSNGTRGVFAGGQGAAIEFFTFATTSDATDFGDLSQAANSQGSGSDGNRMLIGEGVDEVGSAQFITIGTTGNAVTAGETTQTRSNSNDGMSNGSRAVFVAGEDPTPTQYNIIDYFTIGTLADAADFGDHFTIMHANAGTSDGSRGVSIGGVYGVSRQDHIHYFSIGVLGNSIDFLGELTEAGVQGAASCCDGSRGIRAGGTEPPIVNIIDYFPVGVPGTDAADFGDLNASVQASTGTSGD